jgi:sensor domain CHASE-containing protein
MENNIMEKFFLTLFELKKIPAKLIFVVWASCCLILFVPEHFLSKLQLAEFLSEFGKYIGIIFVITFGFLLVVVTTFFIDLFNKKISKKNLRQQIIEKLQELDY